MSTKLIFKIIKIILVIAFALGVESSYGQTHSVMITPWNKTDTTGYGTEIKRLTKKANRLAEEKLESAQHVLDSAFALVKVAPDLRRYAIWLGNMGLILEKNGRSGEAAYWLDLSLKLARRYDWSVMERQLTNVVACNYIYMGKYDSALYYGLKFLNLASAAKDSTHLFNGNVNLGVMYYKLNDPRNALVFYNKAKNIRSSHGIDQLYTNMGLSYYYLDQYDSALVYYQLARNECQPECNNSIMMQYHYGIGVIFRYLKKYDSARYHLTESKRIAGIKDDERFLAENALMLGEVDIETGNFVNAKYQLQYGEELSKRNSLSAIEQRAYLNFIDLFDAIGDIDKKALYQAKYIEQSPIVYSEELLSRITLVVNESNESANIKRIEAQKCLLTIQNNLAKSRNMVLVLASFVGGLLLVVFMFLIIANKKKAQVNAMLEDLVEKRTIDLEASYRAAVSTRDGFNHGIKVLTSNAKAQFATLKGFCYMGISEFNNNDRVVLGNVIFNVSEIESLGRKVSE